MNGEMPRVACSYEFYWNQMRLCAMHRLLNTEKPTKRK